MNIQCTIKKKQLDTQMLSILKRLHVDEMKDRHKLPQLESLFFKLQQVVMNEKIEKKQKQLAALKKKAQEEAAAQRKQVQEQVAAQREQILKDEMLNMIKKFLKAQTINKERYVDLSRQIKNQSKKTDVYFTILKEAEVNKKIDIEKIHSFEKSAIKSINSFEKSDIDKIHSDKKNSIKEITSDIKLDEVEDFLQRSIKEKQVDVETYDFLKELLEKDKDFPMYCSKYCEIYEQLTGNPFEMVNAHKIFKEREEIKKKLLEETRPERAKKMLEKMDRSQRIEKLDEIYELEKKNELDELEERWERQLVTSYWREEREINEKYNTTEIEKGLQEKKEKKEIELKKAYLQEYFNEYFNKYINAVNKVFTENNIEILKDTLCEKVFLDSEYDCNSNKSIQYISNLKDLLSKNKQKINRHQYIQIIEEMINDQDGKLFQYNNHELFQYITQDINYFIAFVCVFAEALNNKAKSKAVDILYSRGNTKNSIFKDMSTTQIIKGVLNDDYNKQIITLDIKKGYCSKKIEQEEKLISKKISKHKMELTKVLDKQIDVIKHLDKHFANIEKNQSKPDINRLEAKEQYIFVNCFEAERRYVSQNPQAEKNSLIDDKIVRYYCLEAEEQYISQNPQAAKNSLIDDKIVQYYKLYPNVVFRFLCMYDLTYFILDDKIIYDLHSFHWAENGIFPIINRCYQGRFIDTLSENKTFELEKEKMMKRIYEDFSHQAKNKIIEAEKLLYSIYQLLLDYKTLTNLYRNNNQSFLDLYTTVHGEIKDNITNCEKNENIKDSTQIHDAVISFAFHTTIDKLVLSALEGLKKDIKKFNSLIIDIKNVLVKIVQKEPCNPNLSLNAKNTIISNIRWIFNDKNAIHNQFNQISETIDFPIEQSKSNDERLSREQQLNPSEEFNNISKSEKLLASLGAGTGMLASIVAVNKKINNKSNPNEQGNMSNASPIGTPTGPTEGVDNYHVPTGELSNGNNYHVPTGKLSNGNNYHVPTGELSNGNNYHVPRSNNANAQESSGNESMDDGMDLEQFFPPIK